MATRIYKDVAFGDHVYCNQCGAEMLLPCGATSCPECYSDGTLRWGDVNMQECGLSELGTDLIITGRTLQLEDFLDPETLQEEYPDYYKQLMGKQIKHTDFYSMVRCLKRMEYKELYDAVNAHGGSYTWNLGNTDSYPIIAVNLDGISPSPVDVCVSKVYIDSKNNLQIKGVDKEYGNECDFSYYDVFAGYLSYIIDYIPCTSVVQSVENHSLVEMLIDAGLLVKQGDGIKITHDGFVWKVLTKEEAQSFWRSNCVSLYKLYDDDTEGEIESKEELNEAINASMQIGIEVEFITNDRYEK